MSKIAGTPAKDGSFHIIWSLLQAVHASTPAPVTLEDGYHNLPSNGVDG
jgi:hypothetical protein